MDPERWRQVEELYHTALKVEPEQRAALLDSRCGHDAALRQEVESLLGQAVSGNSFMEEPALEVAARQMAQGGPSRRDGDLKPGSVVGNFKIIEKLGGGGMGVVYKACCSAPTCRGWSTYSRH